MAKRKIERLLLIVCEGTNTETQYFGWLAEKYAYPNKIWDKIEVCSNAIIPNDIVMPKASELGGQRKKRPLKFENPNKRKSQNDVLKELWEYVYGTDIDSEKYEDIKAQPLRYVAQAQCIEEHQGVYDEIWAVFDRNGHTHHQEAFERAKRLVNGKKTHIGFSSRSFEQWILLHFEQSDKPFELTECKIDKIPIGCNETLGCKGEKCLVGYIRKNYYPNYEKSNKNDNLPNLMNVLIARHTIAFQNAIWLREQKQNELKVNHHQIYQINPYVDIDILVKRILGV